MTKQTGHPVAESGVRGLGPVFGRVPVDGFAGGVHVDWDPRAAVTPLGR